MRFLVCVDFAVARPGAADANLVGRRTEAIVARNALDGLAPAVIVKIVVRGFACEPKTRTEPTAGSSKATRRVELLIDWRRKERRGWRGQSVAKGE